MSDVTVELDEGLYRELLAAANEAGVEVSEFANGLIRTYLEDNYGEV